MTYTHQCLECDREYPSDDQWPGFCPRCARVIAAQNHNDAGAKTTGYTVDMTRKGANREAVKLKDEKS